MKFIHLKQALPIIVLIFILTAVYWINFQSIHVVNGPRCDLVDGACSTSEQDIVVILEVLDTLQIEEELNLSISYSPAYQIKNAWVEGVNMFMGRFFVELQKPGKVGELTRQNGIFFLGSCSEPVMQWKLVVELKNGDGQLLYREFMFSTSQV